ncbi:MAG: lipid-A-disaccharide synthase [Cyanobacteria bacterium HKST-UBA03]|nr:lipid-A-disaccharide synthase [Cyanobacteria bacterium HKST-UBA03]
MAATMGLNRVFIITGDVSGDAHAAGIVRAFQALGHTAPTVEALGGLNVAQTGIKLFEHQTELGALGPSFFSAIPSHYMLGRRLLAYLHQDYRPDAVLLIDYGGFNLHMAEQIKKRLPTTKVYYYIPPQIWASRPWRIKAVQRYVDHVFCIFPFEEAFYRGHGVSASYVGHPLTHALPPPVDRSAFCQRHNLDAEMPIVGVFPGSRKMEIEYLLPPMIQSLPLIQSAYGYKPLQFVVAKAHSISAAWFNRFFDPVREATDRLRFSVIEHDNHGLLSASRAVMLASGTVTLEAALYETPMVVAYDGPGWARFFFDRFRLSDYLGLPNLLCEHPPLVDELLKEAVTPYRLCESMVPLLKDDARRSAMVAELSRIRQKLGEHDAAEAVVHHMMGIAPGLAASRKLETPVSVG